MGDINAGGAEDDRDELEDLEPEPADAENIKGGAADSEPSGHGGKGGSG